MLGIYFSATGNSRYASEVFLKELDCTAPIVSIEDKTAASGSRCTVCYRCVNSCPGQAITLLGKEVIEQTAIEKYTS